MLSLSIHIKFRKSKINDKYLILCSICISDEKVLWFDIPMYNSFCMDLLDNSNHLLSQQAASLDIEASIASTK